MLKINGVKSMGQVTENKNMNISNELEKRFLTQDLSHLAKSLLNTLRSKDPLTLDHSLKVADYCQDIATELGMSQNHVNSAYLSGLFHDIGKLCIPYEVLYKTGKLKEDEIRTFLQHPTMGANMVSKITQLKNISSAIESHHERWNGKGYPQKLVGEEIPILSRIIGVADSFDAMTTHRTYRVAKTFSKAVSELLQQANILYDPEVVSAFKSWLIRNELVNTEQFTADCSYYTMLTDRISKTKTMGLAWVLSGRIFVQNPVDNHPKATIIPCPEIQLLHNWNLTSEKIVVSQGDAIEVIPESTRTPGSINLLISKDKMSAQINIKLDRNVTYVLQDSFPVNKLMLKVKSVIEEVCTYTLASLEASLKENNIVYGIDDSVLSSLINNPTEVIATIAKGTPPGDTVDDRIEIVCEIAPVEYVEEQESAVNHKERRRMPTIAMGETIAVIHPGVRGEDGITVTNEIFKSREPYKVKINTNRGTKVTENGLRIFATIDGRPKISKVGSSWTFSVEPVLVVSSSVNLETGNIYFKGDIQILKSVETGMSVTGGGNVFVSGLASQCKITAGANLTVFGNIINSNIIGGAVGVIEEAIRPGLSEILNNLEAIYTSAVLLLEKSKGTGIKYGNILSILVDKKFKNFPKLIDELAERCQELDIKLLGASQGTIKLLLEKFSGLNIFYNNSSEQLQKHINDLSFLLDYGFNKFERPYLVRINSALNSTIISSGDVIAEGSECYNTIIKANGNVKIDGIMRGGMIEAKGNVHVNEVGSPAGNKTILSAGKDKFIKINKAYAGTTFKLGNNLHLLTQDDINITVSLDKEGYIRIIRRLY